MPRRLYSFDVLERLLEHGVRPRCDTDPGRIRSFLNDLYAFELRRLRGELVAEEKRRGRKLRREYTGRVLALRQKYSLLSQPVETWTERDPS